MVKLSKYATFHPELMEIMILPASEYLIVCDIPGTGVPSMIAVAIPFEDLISRLIHSCDGFLLRVPDCEPKTHLPVESTNKQLPPLQSRATEIQIPPLGIPGVGLGGGDGAAVAVHSIVLFNGVEHGATKTVASRLWLATCTQSAGDALGRMVPSVSNFHDKLLSKEQVTRQNSNPCCLHTAPGPVDEDATIHFPVCCSTMWPVVLSKLKYSLFWLTQFQVSTWEPSAVCCPRTSRHWPLKVLFHKK